MTTTYNGTTVEASSWAAMFSAQSAADAERLREAASEALDEREDDIMENATAKVTESRDFEQAVETAVEDALNGADVVTKDDIEGFVDEEHVERAIEEALFDNRVIEKAAAGAVREAVRVATAKTQEVADLTRELRAALKLYGDLHDRLMDLEQAARDRAALPWWRRLFA
jgi:hypothetical protein